jgi:DNA replication and repair protein RecF
LHLQTLKLTHFKNYEAQTLDLSPRLNCFTGLNGMGKTNILDAVHYLCLTKSHRGLPDRHLIQHETDFLRVEGLFMEAETTTKIVIKCPSGQRKTLERNGNEVTRLADHIGLFPAVMIAPDDVSLVQEGSEERRRFLDTTLSQISADYLHNLLTYNALIKQRNALLKLFGEQRRFDPVLLESIDRQLPAPAAVISASRQQFCADLQPLFTELYAIIANSREAATIVYETDIENGMTMADLLLTHRDRDRALERTSTGPHRDDLVFQLDGQPIKKFASQGQLKSFLLALRLAQYEVLHEKKGVAPILLLDDIFDKLDANRVRQLIGLLLERQYGQIFITDTQRERIESVIASFSNAYTIFEVQDGTATAL